jgi:hypothetical protein
MRALIVDTTGHVDPIEIESNADILNRFTDDVRGKTIQELDGIYIREWRSCTNKHGIRIVDAYDQNLRRVDLPNDSISNLLKTNKLCQHEH